MICYDEAHPKKTCTASDSRFAYYLLRGLETGSFDQVLCPSDRSSEAETIVRIPNKSAECDERGDSPKMLERFDHICQLIKMSAPRACLLIAPPTSLPYGMWRAAVALVALSSVALQSVYGLASEGGYIAEPWIYDSEKDVRQEPRAIPEDYEMEEIYRQAVQSDPNDAILEGIIRQIQRQQQQEATRPQEYDQQYDQPVEIDLQQEPLKADIPIDTLTEKKPEANKVQPKAQVEEAPKESELPKQAEQKPLVAQKKGQSEYVSFVEPVEAKQTKSIPSLDKRRLKSSADSTSLYPKYSTNLLTIAVGTVVLVGLVGTVVGGGYILKRRHDYIDDSDYAPYSGSGPVFGVRAGNKKKSQGDAQDEKMAYKAQLHHYQQTKQKIICGDAVPGGIESEGEEEVDDENNFSVYECPGLASTTDMEVVNPNFCANP